ncbi:MAG: hypothetical protein RJQ09_18190 [Cyclobacteriaceae bacterium]
MKNIITIFLTLTILAFYGCGPAAKTEETSDATEETTDIREKVEREFEYPVPTSFQVTSLLQTAGAGFVLGITNPVENVDRYETQRDKALNLGIYGADLSYSSTYNRQEETMAFLGASKKLVDDLQMGGIFDDQMVSRVESNITNKDSLILIITESFYDTYEYLNQNGQSKLSLLVVAGSWIEGLYITTQLAISSGYDDRIMDIVAKQKAVVKQLNDLLSENASDEDIASIMPLLNSLTETYSGIEEGSRLTEEQLSEIFSVVDSTRSEIVGES